MKKLYFSIALLLCSHTVYAENKDLNKAEHSQKNCYVDPDIQRKQIPKTPDDMSLPNFGQGIIGWGTGAEGTQNKLINLNIIDIQSYKKQGVTLAMIQEWQAFYENESKRNTCNPTAPLRAELMKKIALMWQ
ncbi:DUF4951 domain-containing protein [Acinetobacter stercoris]|uniref:DUF4951 domain-containing protein n=1 Tax=Acinetobacter stercoris TaxID=2126983 RepID=A0A2U3N2P8_9GAMM|nr:DUF4951 domain-containing protein [Acinetobacter stercoris]SPL71894.1 hypothetical protein KPC_3072 [Acinetobacter stercoris]